jgi:Zn-dependent M28 family amino/carboxypeptidase
MKLQKCQLFVGLLVLVASAPTAGVQSSSVDRGQLLKDLQVLAADDMQGRQPGTPGGEKACEYIVRRFKEAGIEPLSDSYMRSFNFQGRGDTKDRLAVNVIGVIRGTRDPLHYIVITAHFDHLGVIKGQVFNGADDNASGVAVLLAIAARLSVDKPQHSVIFAALDAEESGLLGAREFMRAPPVPPSAIVVNVNLDMVARDADNKLFAVGTHHYPFLKEYLADVARPPVKLLFGHDVPGAKQDDWTRDSDHFPFHQAGIPFVYFGVEDEAQHHKPTDDSATVTTEFFVGAANTILAAVRSFDANLEAIQKRSAR